MESVSSPGSGLLLLAAVLSALAAVAHVGDSRLYHFDARRLLFRTADHSVGELLASQHEATADGQRDSRLYMCLGGRNRVEPEIGSAAVGKRDWFLLCSDGLWSQLDDGDLMQAAAAKPAQGIAALARQKAGSASDNVSLVVARQRPRGLLRRIVSPGTWFSR